MNEPTTEYNRTSWNHKVEKQDKWTKAISPKDIQEARKGRFSIVLTPLKPVPAAWLGEVNGKRILCLACGGGQQAPILSAAGADVTTLDLSEGQLGQDQMVAEREGLRLKTEHGDMRDLSRFENDVFDLIFHPVSNCFIPDVKPVWKEAFRVLKPGGSLLSGFANPTLYLFHLQGYEDAPLTVRYKLPYADETDLPKKDLARLKADKEPMEYGHTLQDQIGAQLKAGFVLKGFFEDTDTSTQLSQYTATFFATWAVKIS